MASYVFLNLADVKITNHEKCNYNTFSKNVCHGYKLEKEIDY
jgi:hypothetical protein